MAITNLGELKAAVADQLARPFADIATEFANALTMFESEFASDPEARLSEMETAATLTVADGVAVLPPDFIELRNVVDSKGNVSASYYLSGSELVFPSNGSDGSGISQVTVVYYASFPSLKVDSDTNWLLTRYPHLYLYGILIEIGFWLVDASMIQIYQAKYDRAFTKLRGADIGKRWGGTSVIISGPTP